ncbi:MAG TPA: nucleotidyl transferase AbiEii/AbiGii toxin family protein [Candidatus Omnitrophota bacterium]|nr:nucleotidyl transferase AbiEii/AbiGii toxin family protein [Candidatus Omnitrophota bacterium]
MKDYCLELAAAQKSGASKYNAMREYLQAYVLRIMHDRNAFRSTAFVGGTALRFLYGLPRFSEDLDFSLHEKSGYSFVDLMKIIKQELILAGYEADVSYDETKTVQSAFVKFEGLLYEAKLSALKAQKFSIKLEIDTRPPGGAVLTTQIVNKFFPIAFLSYDLPSLLAGKIHALLTRKYTKGRDYFDIAWYLSRFKTLVPNFELLRNALTQTGYTKKMPGEGDWRQYLSDILGKADWKTVHKDVVNFLENPRDMDVFTKENVMKIIGA